MKKNALHLFCFLGLLFIGCNTATPEKYFDAAVLNCNMMMGFANEGMLSQLEQPSVKMIASNPNMTAPMKRKEVIETKIEFLEDEYAEVKQLKETDDAKAILQSSLALYEFALPVYKTKYVQLAKLYDDGASKESIQSLAQGIHDKYFSKFDELYNKLIAAGKLYAEKHHIKVEWRN